MLTKEQIETIRWVVNVDDVHFSERAVAELRRLALLSLKHEESRARVEACIEAETHVETSVLADSFGAFPDLEPEPERDARAERIGRAVLAFGADATWAREVGEHAIGQALDPVEHTEIGELLHYIADATEEP